MTQLIKLPARDPASQPNAVFVQMLNGALPFLWDGTGGLSSAEGRGLEQYICLAISKGAPNGMPRGVWVELCQLVDDRLDGSTFGVWAEMQGKFTPAQVQAGRKAWILDLINEFGSEP